MYTHAKGKKIFACLFRKLSFHFPFNSLPFSSICFLLSYIEYLFCFHLLIFHLKTFHCMFCCSTAVCNPTGRCSIHSKANISVKHGKAFAESENIIYSKPNYNFSLNIFKHRYSAVWSCISFLHWKCYFKWKISIIISTNQHHTMHI